MSGSTNQNEKERGFIFTPKVEEEGRIDEFPGLDNVPKEQMELIEVSPLEVLDDDELQDNLNAEKPLKVEMALMGEDGKIIPDIDLRSVKTPEELIVITEEIKKEVESEVEIEGKLMEGVDETDDLNKKNYIKITPTLYIKPVESDKTDAEGKKVEVYKILNPVTKTVETRELTDKEKREIQILRLKESHIKFQPIKNALKTVGVHTVESSIGRKRQVKDKEAQTNLTTNQFGKAYRKARKRKNKLQKQSRKLARKK